MQRFRVVAFEHLLDASDGAMQLVDKIFIRNGEQIGQKSANMLPDLSVFLATSPYLKQILAIHSVDEKNLIHKPRLFFQDRYYLVVDRAGKFSCFALFADQFDYARKHECAPFV